MCILLYLCRGGNTLLQTGTELLVALKVWMNSSSLAQVISPALVLCRGLVRQLSIDQLDNEGRRVSIYDKALPEGGKSPMFHRSLSVPGVHKRVINELLRPRQWKPNMEDRHFMLQVMMLLGAMQAVGYLGLFFPGPR
jgi:hypothetical protein